MKDWFEKLIELSLRSTSQDNLRDQLQALTRGYGFEYFAYLNLRSQRAFAVSTYPDDWQNRYMQKAYSTIDPIVASAKRQIKPFMWTLNPSTSISKELRPFYAEACEFGIQSGLTVPVHAGFDKIAMLTLATSRTPPMSPPEVIDPILAATAVAQLHVRMLLGEDSATATANVPPFSPKETIYLRWAAAGNTYVEIALMEKDTYANVRFHINSAKQKMGVRSLKQAISFATRYGLI